MYQFAGAQQTSTAKQAAFFQKLKKKTVHALRVKSANKDKIIELRSELKGFKLVTTLFLKFEKKKTNKQNKTKC